jgi:CSLREA domain-containing protein
MSARAALPLPVRFPLLLTAALGASFAQAAVDIVVSNTTDSFRPACVSDCSLREAIHQANLDPGPNRILLQAGTYTLTREDPVWNPDEEPDADEDAGVRGDLDVLGELSILGVSEDASVIQGVSDRLLEVLPGAALKLRRVTLQDGRGDTFGGAIRNDGDTLISNVRFLNNRATPGIQGQGGAIANFNTLSVSHSLFQDNNSHGDDGFWGRGGAIYNRGVLLVRDASFEHNSVTDSDVDFAQGGAIYNEGNADVARSTFHNNRAGTFAGGGGASAIANNYDGVFRLSNSTVSGNLGTEVNGVVANGLAGFSPTGSSAQMQLINVTIAGNAGLGLSNIGKLSIRNSLIAGNQLAGTPANCEQHGSSYSARGLLLGTDLGACTADSLIDDAITFTQVLHPLADNHGTTQTHGLRKGSPALDAGQGTCIRHDQRGLSRPRDGNGDGLALCDLGAYERSRP